MEEQNHYRSIYLIGLAMIGFMLIGSIVFYQERMLFVDPAFITFEIIQQDWFVFSEHRYGAFITQIAPLLGDYFGLSLKAILIGYSMSFYLFFLAVVYLCGSVLKQYKLAVVFCCYLTFLVSDVYFWPNNEVHQAMGWMIGFLSLFNWARVKGWLVPFWIHPLLVVLLGLATISHLLIVIPLGFLWVYLLLDNQPKKDRKSTISLIAYSILILGFIVLRYWMSKESWYDGNKLDAVQTATIAKVAEAFTNTQSASFLALLIKRYWLSGLIALIGFATLLYKKKHLKLGLTIGSLIVYFGLVVMTHPVEINESNLFYFESQWMCLSIMMVTPFIWETLLEIKTQKLVLLLSVAIFLLQVPKFYLGLTKFQSRLTSLKNIVDEATQQSISKGYKTSSQSLEDTYLMTWGLPIETLLLTSINEDKPVTSIKLLPDGQRVTQSKDSIYTAFDLIPINELDSDYFEVDQEGGYERVD